MVFGLIERINEDLYNQGIEKGEAQKEYKKNYAFAKSLLLNTDFDIAQIAELVGVQLSLSHKLRTIACYNKKAYSTRLYFCRL